MSGMQWVWLSFVAPLCAIIIGLRFSKDFGQALGAIVVLLVTAAFVWIPQGTWTTIATGIGGLINDAVGRF